MQEMTTPFTSSDYEGKKILVLTGAGASVESGIPCYWGENGSYKRLEEEFGAQIGDVLSGSNFKKNPKQVWQYMKRLFDDLGDVKPNLAHIKIAKLEKVASEFHLVTQNCDTLHSLAGSVNVHEVHGTAENAMCTSCGALDYDYRKQLSNKDVPECVKCGSHLRPNVVLFEEMPRMDLMMLQDFARRADLLIVVGTQAYFSYITELLNDFALTGGERVWVDMGVPSDIEGNWMINPVFNHGLKYYPHGAVSFFEKMMPDL